MAPSTENVSFFDKIINATFYKWVDDPETMTAQLTAAFTIRSDRPRPGVKIFEPVMPPEKNTSVYKFTMSSDDINKALNPAKGFLPTKDFNYYGPKPNMRLQLTLLQETICTAVTLTIENLTLEIDITDYSAMYIEAGYSASNGGVVLTTRFYAAIFSSYTESPNPSGRTVFTGIVGNWLVKGLRAQPHTISIDPGPYSFYNFVHIICSYLGIAVHMNLPERCLKAPINWSNSNIVRAQSAYQVLDWLTKSINMLTSVWRQTANPEDKEKTLIDKNDIVCVRFVNDYLTINLANEASDMDLNKMAIDLNRISSASFQRGLLNIIAPWNPLLSPGSLFHMERSFFRGRMLPNIAHEALTDKQNLYRPIAIDVTFETNSNVNQMRVEATAARIGTYNQLDGPQVPALYPNTDGIYKTIEEIKKETEETNSAYRDGSNAAFYYTTENVYAVGILSDLENEAVAQEVKRREEIAFSFNSDQNNNPINKDIVIKLNDEAISRWATFNEDMKNKKLEAPTDTPPPPAVDRLIDPARNSAFLNLVDGSKQSILSRTAAGAERKDSTWSSYWTYYESLRGVAWLEGDVKNGVVYISKDRSGVGSHKVSIEWLLRAMCALYSFKEYSTQVEKNTEDPAAIDVWAGNTFSMFPCAYSSINFRGMQEKYPPPSVSSKFIYMHYPQIPTGADINTLLDTYGDYLLAVVEFWEKLNEIEEDKYQTSLYVQVNALKNLVEMHKQWPDTPWIGWKDRGPEDQKKAVYE